MFSELSMCLSMDLEDLMQMIFRLRATLRWSFLNISKKPSDIDLTM